MDPAVPVIVSALQPSAISNGSGGAHDAPIIR
jgi:hypothetical protein